MAKSDLLKQAIADAKAVKETALANAKIALQEAFAPRLESMLHSKLIAEIEDEEMDMDAEAGMEAGAEAGMEDFPTSVNVGLDFNDDGDYDLTGMLGGDEEMEAGAEEDDLNLEEILRELEETEPSMDEPMTEPTTEPAMEGYDEELPEGMEMDAEYDYTNESIDSIIEAILREEEMATEPTEQDPELLAKENEELEATVAQQDQQLKEAYKTVKYLKSVINEVNLLNAKLLYTNKLFRNFELNESQKMKVIENFDRAVSTREAKLVFATLAESFNKPTQKRRMVKESAASRPHRTTAPSQQTTQILSEGFEMANRWKKLAGLI